MITAVNFVHKVGIEFLVYLHSVLAFFAIVNVCVKQIKHWNYMER